MNDEKVFVDGMIIKNKSDGTPDWVKEKGSLSSSMSSARGGRTEEGRPKP